ncbi:aminoacyl-tRNA deacylase [endosymbiont of Ridgeia piscesae]|jgi:Ala-tRNA(Pro) deacylase|uniref:Ala-tRNA(Pro) deacylase n=1 Tax=endosymbiont of Ridgeia piscesae TaxID=54398 RepID=A0A0T5Z5M0_9GAMM|nr:YbaK/EbsC family protein [endosymbiont of Ridgeia piscesae]KRT55141.1 Cys-tRNA(Pro) deacylase, prolyl-tRNA editing enzyme YbaK/EbsC [endosymbiont of Ridgeia piscesae]KRT58061.1 Ala-tRNA(Pro) deacylase [endosymbiont of Ridgeia piscesae]
MSVAITFKEFLQNKGIEFDVIEHSRTDSALRTSEAMHVPGDKMAKSVLLGDDQSYLMVVIPATHRLQFERLKRLTGRELELIEEDELSDAFADCEPGSVPPSGQPYGIETLLDRSLADQPEIYFEAGDHSLVIRVSRQQFLSLLGDAEPVNVSEHI